MLLVIVRVVKMEFLGSESMHDRVEDTELERGERTNHDTSCAETGSAQVDDTELLSHVQHTGRNRSSATFAGLVHLREKSISWVRDNSRDDTRNDTRAQRNLTIFIKKIK
jgi:hypothetical protein